MLLFITIVAASCFLSHAAKFPEFDCSGRPDELVWWGCRSYGLCINGQHQQTDCVNGTAYDQRTGDCVEVSSAAFPCNLNNVDCSQYDNTIHRIPEMQTDGEGPPCQFYYTCVYGYNAGHQSCPEGTVFDEDSQSCKKLEDTIAPCGTFVPETY